MIDILGNILMGIGAACSIIGTLGIIRFPDVYNRLHAQTVSIVGGAIMVLLGISLTEGLSMYSLKALTIALFMFLTAPVGSHAIARAAHKSGVKLWPKSVVDKLEEEKP